ncbi:MAG TPA: hypothetical protein VFY93_04295 [Planctomycetota bacterium]|nr:hypothetical protein [Planctomycetota bacterium]
MAGYPEDDGLFRLLGSLPREGPPPIPVERLFRRLLWRRVRAGAAVLAAVAIPLGVFLATRDTGEPPVNLKLRVVDVPDPAELPARDPPELNLP